MNNRLDGWPERDGRMTFYRVLAATSWAFLSLLIIWPYLWIAIMPLFDDDGSAAIFALASVIVGGLLGYAATITLIKRLSR